MWGAVRWTVVSRARSGGVDAVEQRPSLGGAAMVRAEGGQAGVVGGCGPGAGLATAAQPQDGGGHGQLDGAGLRAALLLGQAAAQLVGALSLGESRLVPRLAVEAAGQAEPQDQGEPVRYVMGGEALAGERLGLRVASLRVEGEDQSIAGGRRTNTPNGTIFVAVPLKT